jgi:hypothetical protein
MLGSDILVESFPCFGTISHLGEENRLETPGLMVRVERILVQFSRVDPSFCRVRNFAQHGISIAVWLYQGKRPNFSGVLFHGLIRLWRADECTGLGADEWQHVNMKVLTAALAPVTAETLQPQCVNSWRREK